MTLTSALGVIGAGVFGLAAALFLVASSMSLGSSDAAERKDATVSAFWSLVMVALCCAAILTLTGCATLKYAECIARDNTARPCQ
jgi:Na+/proline symporter